MSHRTLPKRMVVFPAENATAIVVRPYDPAALREAVGGYLEAIPIKTPAGNATMYLDEEGKCKQRCPNLFATAIAHLYGNLPFCDLVVGTVVIVGPPDERGNDTDAPEWAVQMSEPYGFGGSV